MTKRFNQRDKTGMLHYLILNIRERMRPFARDEYARLALELLQEHCNLHPAKLIAYVAMPNHLHVIINPKDGECERFLSHYKPAVTNAIESSARQQGRRQILDWLARPEGHNQLWQEGKHDFLLYSERLIRQKIDYIHNNPIRGRLVRKADEYPFSSFRAWYPDFGEAVVPIDRDFWWEE